MSMTKPRPALEPNAVLKPCGCPHMPPISRRNFLKATGVAGLVAGIAGEDMFTRMAFGATPYTGDVLVVLSLRGGFDGLSAIVPAAAGDYNDYAALRPNIKIPSGQLIQLTSQFGMHPAMAPLKPFWDAQAFGVVHAVGMAQPNRSHFDAMEEMGGLLPAARCARVGSIGSSACANRARRSRPRRWDPTRPRRRSSGRTPSSRCTTSTRSTWTEPGTTRSGPNGMRPCAP